MRVMRSMIDASSCRRYRLLQLRHNYWSMFFLKNRYFAILFLTRFFVCWIHMRCLFYSHIFTVIQESCSFAAFSLKLLKLLLLCFTCISSRSKILQLCSFCSVIREVDNGKSSRSRAVKCTSCNFLTQNCMSLNMFDLAKMQGFW